MDLKKKKYKIIEALMAVEEPRIINALENILEINLKENLEADVFMDEAEEDIKVGRTYSINDAKKMIANWKEL